MKSLFFVKIHAHALEEESFCYIEHTVFKYKSMNLLKYILKNIDHKHSAVSPFFSTSRKHENTHLLHSIMWSSSFVILLPQQPSGL